MIDETAVFESFFKPVEGGYRYYVWRWGRGYSITRAERDEMVAAFRRRLRSRNIWTIVLGVAIALALILAAFALLRISEAFFWPLVIAASAAFFAWQRWSMRDVLRPIRGRKPDAPRRDGREFDVAMGRAWGRMGLVWIVMFGCIAAMNLVSFDDKSPAIAIPLAVLFVGLFLFALRVMVRTILARRHERV